jgi:hypothetical protein
MKNNNKRQISFVPRYLFIDEIGRVTRTVNNIDDCQFVLIRKEDRDLNPSFSNGEFVKRVKQWLEQESPKYSWYFQISRSGNFGFWKEEPSKPTGEDWGNQSKIEKAKKKELLQGKQKQLTLLAA